MSEQSWILAGVVMLGILVAVLRIRRGSSRRCCKRSPEARRNQSIVAILTALFLAGVMVYEGKTEPGSGFEENGPLMLVILGVVVFIGLGSWWWSWKRRQEEG